MVDVLNLEWSSGPSRDRNTASLICNYLKYQGLSVYEGSIFEGFSLIDRKKPRLVLLTNATGAVINFEIAKYASLSGIKVVTLTSEGNFKDDDDLLDEFLWGWNVDRFLYEDVNMQWSDRTRNLSLKHYPELESKIRVSGSCGMDIYKINPTISKHDFLEKHNRLGYDIIVGVGCWDFDVAYPGGRVYDSWITLYGETVLERFRNDRDSFNKILSEVIRDNPNVLFLLKEHPGNIKGAFMSGIDGLEAFCNTLILKSESIIDCIAVSDFWLTYESTTVFEAWMLGKETCLLNPSGIDFPRANSYLGSPNYSTTKELQNAIMAFCKDGELPGYREMKSERERAIKDSIQWADGLNHVRAGNEVISILKSDSIMKSRRIPLSILKSKAKQNIVNFFRIIHSSIYQRSSQFKQEEVCEYSATLYKQQLDFYSSNGLNKEALKKISCI